MPLLKWSNAYSIGVEHIDTEHRQLLALLNDIGDAIKDDTAKDSLGGFLERMRVYASNHFTSEEKFMMECNFPGLELQRDEHSKLLEIVNDLIEKKEDGHEIKPIDVLSFAIEWLENHLVEADSKIGIFLKEKGLT